MGLLSLQGSISEPEVTPRDLSDNSAALTYDSDSVLEVDVELD